MVLLDVASVVESAIESVDPQGIDISVYDDAPDTPERFLYFHPSRLRLHPITDAERRAEANGTPTYSTTLPVGNHTWRLLFASTGAAPAAYRTFWPWVVVFVGLTLTASVAGYTQSRLAHTEASARFVRDLTERTARLAE